MTGFFLCRPARIVTAARLALIDLALVRLDEPERVGLLTSIIAEQIAISVKDEARALRVAGTLFDFVRKRIRTRP